MLEEAVELLKNISNSMDYLKHSEPPSIKGISECVIDLHGVFEYAATAAYNKLNEFARIYVKTCGFEYPLLGKNYTDNLERDMPITAKPKDTPVNPVTRNFFTSIGERLLEECDGDEKRAQKVANVIAGLIKKDDDAFHSLVARLSSLPKDKRRMLEDFVSTLESAGEAS
jgi:hypothetical protein